MNIPTVSIVTPTYNRISLLPLTVKSILDQTWPNIEYIVVDDGSTDGTSEYLETLSDRVKIVKQTNAGQTAAVTKGWKEATGAYLGYLSDDDMLQPNVVERIVRYLESNADASAAFPNSDLVDLKGRVIQKSVSRPFRLDDVVTEHECFIGPGALFRRSAYEAAGEWDRNCRVAPDMEFWTRLGSIGHIELLDDITALYRVHAQSLSVHGIVSAAMVDEFIYIADKYFGGPFCPQRLRDRKSLSLANAHLIAARGHLRAGRFAEFGRSLATARRYAPESVKLAALMKLARASVPQPFKNSIRRILGKAG